MKRKVNVINIVKNYSFVNQRHSANKLEPKEIVSPDEAIEIGIRMARLAAKHMKLDLIAKAPKS